MKKLLLSIFLLCLPSMATAKVGKRNLASEYATVSRCFAYLAPSSASDQTVGIDGVILYAALTSNALSITDTVGSTQAPARMPYAAEINVDLVDSYSDSTLTCSSITISGKDQFGVRISETLTTVTEAGTQTTNVFSEVNAVVAACAGFTGGLDRIWLAVDGDGLGVMSRIIDADDVVSLCVEDGGVTRCFRQDDGTANDIASVLDRGNLSVDINGSSALPGGATIAQDDRVCITTKPRR